MDFGIMFANTGPFSTRAGATAMGQAAEGAGFESVWTVEHVTVPEGYESEYPYDKSGKMPGGDSIPIPDPLIWLTFVAARTETIKLCTGILILPQRNPVVVAKAIATLDVLSEGRLLLGIGVGWLEEEFDALGVPFAARGKRTDEYVAALRELWTADRATMHGDFVDFDRLITLPKPAQGSVPIIVGGHTEAAARRAGRLGDGFFPGKGKPDELAHLLDVMRAAADDAGRDPGAIEVTAGATGAVFGDDPVGAVQELADLGVHRLIVPPLSFDPDALADALGTFGEDVIAKVG